MNKIKCQARTRSGFNPKFIKNPEDENILKINTNEVEIKDRGETV